MNNGNEATERPKTLEIQIMMVIIREHGYEKSCLV